MIADHDRELLESGKMTFAGEHHIQTPAGEHCVVTARRLPIMDEHGDPKYLLSLIEEVAKRSANAGAISHMPV